MRIRTVLCVVSLLCGLAFAAPALAAGKRAGPGFFGVVPQAPLAASDYDRMQGVVGTLRIPIYWYEVEPQRGTYEFAALDATVGAAADRGIRVLPFVYGSPAWVNGNEARPPLSRPDSAAWMRFLRRLVRRYGPRGEFWRGREQQLPIRRWQVWNEPNFLLFWRPRPSPRGYARLERSSARAIRAADRGATILAAGVAPVEAGMTPWAFLRRLYAVRGSRRYFDVVALHPYAPYVPWVKLQLRFVRNVMIQAGDRRTPLQLTELGVASAGAIPNPYDKGRQGQAAYLRRVLRLAVRNRGRWHIVGVDWFTWQDAPAADPHCVFCQYGGLFDADGIAKPAWWALGSFTASRGYGARAPKNVENTGRGKG